MLGRRLEPGSRRAPPGTPSAASWFGASALALVAIVGLVYGCRFALRVNQSHESSYRVAAVLPQTTGDRPYGLLLDNGLQLLFRQPPGVGVGDPIAVRFDDLGRILGTVRHGTYIPKGTQPSKVIFFVPLALAAGVTLVAVRVNVRVRRTSALAVNDPTVALVDDRSSSRRLSGWQRAALGGGALLIVAGLRLAVLTEVRVDRVETVETVLPPVQRAHPWGVRFGDGNTTFFEHPTGLSPGDQVRLNEDLSGRVYESTIHGITSPSSPQPQSLRTREAVVIAGGAALAIGALVRSGRRFRR